MSATRQRLQKVIAQAGLASRRAAEQWILDGRVKVNGQRVRQLGTCVEPDVDVVEVEGHGRLEPEALVYIVAYKPPGVVSTASDPEGRMTILDVVERQRATGKRAYEGSGLPRVFPVGRLDYDAEGVLLLTNDGALSHQLLRPASHVPKTYRVKVQGRPEPRTLERLRAGVYLPEAPGVRARRSRPCEAEIVKHSRMNTWVDLVLTEGRNHQVKRMWSAVGHRVQRLVRIDFAGIGLDVLEPGQWRFLDVGEVQRLRAWTDVKVAR